jgi:hypothetical protein
LRSREYNIKGDFRETGCEDREVNKTDSGLYSAAGCGISSTEVLTSTTRELVCLTSENHFLKQIFTIYLSLKQVVFEAKFCVAC